MEVNHKLLRKRDIFLFFLTAGLVTAQVSLELKLPVYMNALTKQLQLRHCGVSEIAEQGIPMLLCAVGGMLLSMVTGYTAAYVSADVARSLREMVFKKILSFHSEEMNRFSAASLITRTTNDVTQVQLLIAMGMTVLLRAPLMLVCAMLRIRGKQWQWSAATAVIVVLLLLILLLVFSLSMPKFRKMQQLTDRLNLVTRENLTGIRVVHAYRAEPYQEEKFERENKNLTDTALFATRTMALMGPSMTLAMSSVTPVIYLIGSRILSEAQEEARIALFADMITFSDFAVQIIMSFTMLTFIFIMLPRAAVSIRRIREVLRCSVRIRDGERTEAPETGTVSFRDVSFRYPDAGGDVLRHISFDVKRGETVAIIGATGSGKSTLVNLIPRFYDATEGSVFVDGADVRTYRAESLLEKIGYVSQKAFLFSGTIAENVAYAVPQATEEEIQNAIAIAQGSDFVSARPEGIRSRIAQGSVNISGGQRQRLSIARAICKKPEIYIFDDSFSALDYRTDRALRHALAEHTAGATRLIVAQRIGTIRDADRILVLEDGAIVGSGTHDELMHNCAAYQEIALSQLSKEELENV